jgi:integral membrane protein
LATSEPVPLESGIPARPAHRLLVQYRVMAFTTAVLLIVLVFVGIPLQVGAHRREVVNVVGTLHGFLYIVYLVTAFRLTFKLKVPVWQMILILLAGTVPFAAFVAERKMTKRFEATNGPEDSGSRLRRSRQIRTRWLSRRALLLHLEVIVIAPGCLIAGWWQATRALAGNGLSWVYSVEWPLFALLAIGGWWHLVHEDPDAYRKRKLRIEETQTGPPARTEAPVEWPVMNSDVDASSARLARIFAFMVAAELVLGFVTLAFVPFNRPGGWEPPKGEIIYATHATVGTLITVGALVLLVRFRGRGRVLRLSAWLGMSGLIVSDAGGLLTAAGSLLRVFGMALMLAGAAIAAFAYLIPSLSLHRRPALE